MATAGHLLHQCCSHTVALSPPDVAELLPLAVPLHGMLQDGMVQFVDRACRSNLSAAQCLAEQHTWCPNETDAISIGESERAGLSVRQARCTVFELYLPRVQEILCLGICCHEMENIREKTGARELLLQEGLAVLVVVNLGRVS